MSPIGPVLCLRISQSSRILRSHTQHMSQRGRRRTSSQQDRGCIVLANISKFEDSQIAYAACRSGDGDVEPLFGRRHFYRLQLECMHQKEMPPRAPQSWCVCLIILEQSYTHVASVYGWMNYPQFKSKLVTTTTPSSPVQPAWNRVGDCEISLQVRNFLRSLPLIQ